MEKNNYIFFKERIYIPEEIADIHEIENRFHKAVYNEEKCLNCEYLEERHCDVCDECPNFLGHFKLYKEKEVKGKTYIGIPYGARSQVKKLITKPAKGKDLRANPAFKNPDIEFTGKLRKPQRKAVRKLIEKGYGILKSPPRSGKCVSGDTLIQTSLGTMRIDTFVNTFITKTKKGEQSARLKTDIFVNTEHGPKKVSHVYKKKSYNQVSFKTEKGYSLKGTPEHPVRILTPDLDFVWKRMDEIKEGEIICLATDTLYSKNKINETQARFLGYLVANSNVNKQDGKYQTLVFCSTNKEVLNDYSECGKALFGYAPKKSVRYGVTYLIYNTQEVISKIQEIGYVIKKSAKKRIPDSVLMSGKEIQMAFLSAYLSCDSFFSKNPSSEIELCSASKTLAKQLHLMLLSMNIISRFTTYDSCARNSKNPKTKKYHSIFISGTDRNTLISNVQIKKEVAAFTNKNSLGRRYYHLGKYLKSVVNKQHLGSGIYKDANGNKVAGVIFQPGMYRLNDNPIQAQVDKFDFNFLKLLSEEAYEKTQKVLESGLAFDVVVKTKRHNEKCYVYDISVPETRSFIANGIVSHNTVMATALTCKLKTKTIILASQREWLVGFYETFCGNKQKKLKPLTNIPDLESGNKQIIGFPKTLEDYEKYDICLVTYQSLNSVGGKKILRKIRNMFGLLVLDECLPPESIILASDSKGNTFECTIFDAVNNKNITHVVSYNHDLECKEIKPIISRKETKNELIEIEHETGVLRCSPNHRLWSKTRNCYVYAEDLQEGEDFLTLAEIDRKD